MSVLLLTAVLEPFLDVLSREHPRTSIRRREHKADELAGDLFRESTAARETDAALESLLAPGQARCDIECSQVAEDPAQLIGVLELAGERNGLVRRTPRGD